MDEHILISSRDMLLGSLPFVFLLLLTVFRLDQILASPKGLREPRHLKCGMDESGEPILCDPDGRVWESGRVRHGPSGAAGAGRAGSEIPCRTLRVVRISASASIN